MSEKSKKTTSKKTPAKKATSTKSAPKKKTAAKKPAAKKTTAAKKPAAKKTTAAKKPAAKKTTTAKKPAAKKTTATKKPTAKKTTTKKPATKAIPKARKRKAVKAQIISYRRNNRLQTTNQAIAKVLDEYNHKTLIGKKFVLKFLDSDALAKGVVTAIHGKDKAKLVRIRFSGSGMAGHALNKIGEIYI